MINTKKFEKISLKEMEAVKLMNRQDKKYWFHLNEMQEVLDQISNQYFVLSIDDIELLPYSTTYFDTAKNEMFLNHHNGKLNRYKVRKRTYVNSGISFLEIKFKSNKGRTIKKRIPIDSHKNDFSFPEEVFLSESLPYDASDLEPALQNNFRRITLVNKNMNERCTIDLNLQFEYKGKLIQLNDMVIVEIKTEGKAGNSPLSMALRDLRIKPSGFSKYCVGRTSTDLSLKSNSFKAKIRNIEKMLNPEEKIVQTI